LGNRACIHCCNRFLGWFYGSCLPPLIKQTSNFLKEVPSTIASLNNQDTRLGDFVARHNLQPQIEKISDNLSSKIGDIPSTLLNTATTIAVP